MTTATTPTGRYVRFSVVGTPAAKGNLRSFGRGRMVETTKNATPWREACKYAALDAIGDQPPLDGPLEVTLLFRLAKPKSAPKRFRWPTKKPDLDKLIRSVFDSMTEAGVWGDDAQAIDLLAHKRYADPQTERVGVTVHIAQMLEPGEVYS